MKRSLIGDLLVRWKVCTAHNINNHDFQYYYGDYGKPYLSGHSHIQFNISHSGDWIVGAFSNQPVGIDIEKVIPIDLKIATTFFSYKEQSFLQSDGSDYQSFYEIWAAKESYLKATGMGLSIPLDSFYVIFNKNTNEVCSNLKWYFKKIDIAPSYKSVVCSQMPIVDIKLYMMTDYQLFQNLQNTQGLTKI